jgi:hypothetical protein
MFNVLSEFGARLYIQRFYDDSPNKKMPNEKTPNEKTPKTEIPPKMPNKKRQKLIYRKEKEPNLT